MHAKHIRRDNRLHIHDVLDIHRKRHDVLCPLLDVHGIEEMRRQDHHIYSLPPRLPLHVVMVMVEDVVELDVHYLVCIIEILVLNLSLIHI